MGVLLSTYSMITSAKIHNYSHILLHLRKNMLEFFAYGVTRIAFFHAKRELICQGFHAGVKGYGTLRVEIFQILSKLFKNLRMTCLRMPARASRDAACRVRKQKILRNIGIKECRPLWGTERSV